MFPLWRVEQRLNFGARTQWNPDKDFALGVDVASRVDNGVAAFGGSLRGRRYFSLSETRTTCKAPADTSAGA
jgi:hypothetical protein